MNPLATVMIDVRPIHKIPFNALTFWVQGDYTCMAFILQVCYGLKPVRSKTGAAAKPLTPRETW
jgi:hypothetical protein